MKKSIAFFLFFIVVFVAGWFLSRYYYSPRTAGNPIAQFKPRPLDKYTIENLAKANVPPSEIKIEGVLSEDQNFTSNSYSMTFDPTLRQGSGQALKKVTGVINLPKDNLKHPLILMIRGFVDQQIYTPGTGTKRGAEYFSQNGFITVAPDFLGYGSSDKESSNIFESRFQTYTTVLSTLASLGSIVQWDGKNVFIWSHSNGGQVALTILEITKKSCPTVLWAPVSKPFPYSILYYTDESADLGKLIRQELAKFESDYDVNLYSLTQYLDRIKAPLEINQGTADDAVPYAWTKTLVKVLKTNNPDLKFFTYPGADHNLQPAWDTVIARDLTFFRTHLEN